MRPAILLILLAACVPQPIDDPTEDIENATQGPDGYSIDILDASVNGRELTVDIRLSEGSMEVPMKELSLAVESAKATLFQEEFCDFILSPANYCYEERKEDYDMILEQGEDIRVMYTAETALPEKPGISFILGDKAIGRR